MSRNRRQRGRRTRQAVALAAAAQAAAPHARRLYEKVRRRGIYTVAVAGTDDIYPDLHEWVLERIPEDERAALIASTTTPDHGEVRMPGSIEEEEQKPELRLRYDGSRTQMVRIDGHKVQVQVGREEFQGRQNLPENWRQLLETITFTASTASGRDAVVRMLHGLLRDYRSSGGASFKNFLTLCVRREVIGAVKAATRQKHSPLNEAESMSKPLPQVRESEAVTLADTKAFADHGPCAAERLEMQQVFRVLGATANRRLTSLEHAAVFGIANGETYDEIIAREDAPDRKAIDNAAQRARRKLRGALEAAA